MGLNGPLDVRDRADHGPRGNHRLEPSDRRPQTVTLTGGSAAAPQESDSGAFPRCSRPSLPPSLPPSLTHSFPPPSLHPSINQSINPPVIPPRPGGHPGPGHRCPPAARMPGGLPNAHTVPPPMTAAAGGLTSRRCQQRDP